jgi:DNA-binding transcriptional ArsR family regulator
VSQGLASPERLQILAALASGECSVTVLVARLQRLRPAVSRHLASLRALGLVQVRLHGNLRFYQLAAHDEAAIAIRELVAVLARGVPGTAER